MGAEAALTVSSEHQGGK